MISFTLITSTPAVLANRLVAQGLLEQVTDNFGTNFIGTLDGLEYIEVPNPIKASGSGTQADPYVADSRRCYLVKLALAAEDNEITGLTQVDVVGGVSRLRSILQRTKLGQWIAANSIAVTLTSADGRSWPARRVGTNFWCVISDDFGVWQ